MIFDQDELAAIVRRHAIENLGIPEAELLSTSIQFLDENGNDLDTDVEVQIELKTQKGMVPGMGPYRSSGK